MSLKLDPRHHPAIRQKRLDGAPISALAKEYVISETQIGRILKAGGVAVKPVYYRKHTFDVAFFDTIDTEEKAYVLGFLYADGCNATEHGSVSIVLSAVDAEILTRIASCLGYTGTLSRRMVRCNDNEYPSVGLYLNSRVFSDRCVDIGIVRDKSFAIRMPDETVVPATLMRHFIRGYFDGDGSISFNPDKNRRANLNVIGNAEFIDALRERLVSHTDTSGYRHLHANGRSVYLSISGNQQVERVLDYLYADCTIALKRKHDKYALFKSKRREFSKRPGCASRFFGVTRSSSSGGWRAVVRLNGKSSHQGVFATEEEAAQAHDRFCIAHGHNLQRLNFPAPNAA